MTPSIPVSWGELIDKITILEIKAERLRSADARSNVQRELAQLNRIAKDAENATPALVPLKAELRRLNETLWQIEDDIRAKEAKKDFGAQFVELARAVYRNNDARGRTKQAIDRLMKSDIAEEKQYTEY